MNSSLLIIILGIFLVQINAHSMMTCGVLNSNNQCVGAVRNAQQSLSSTNYRFDNVNPCQPEARGVSNLATKYSTANPMGQLSSGQQFTIQWSARNHAVANQSPRVVKMYLSPAIQNGQTADASWNSFQENMFCTGPYTNCGNGPNVDTQGDTTPCTLTCNLPSLSNGIYTMLWHWNWTQNDGSNYMTCADIQVGGSAVTPTTAASSSTPRASTTSNAQSSAVRASTTSNAQSSTVRAASSATSNSQTAESTAQTDNTNTNGQSGCPDLIDRCNDLCGEGLVKSCSCKNGQFAAECASPDEDSSSTILSISSIVLLMLTYFA